MTERKDIEFHIFNIETVDKINKFCILLSDEHTN